MGRPTSRDALSIRRRCRTDRRATTLLLLVAASSPVRPATMSFTDIAATSGLRFVHFNGMSGELYFPENVGSGGALLDFDGDGDLDTFLVQGGMLGDRPLAEATFPRDRSSLGHRLFRNDLAVDSDGRLDPRFVDVTSASDVDGPDYGMGVAVADLDGDGFVDLFVTGYGDARLWLSNGDGSYRDGSAGAGIAPGGWTVAASPFDYDRDGDVDLFVGSYLDAPLARHKRCRKETGERDYCHPESFDPLPNQLLRNRGDATFEDVTVVSGLAAVHGGALGAISFDADGDGWLDLYVANDMRPNQLWRNRGDGTFAEDAWLAGCAVDEHGRPQASMGVVAGDLDGDGDEDLFLTHLDDQTHTLYLNEGAALFVDRSRASGIAEPSRPVTGFGVGLLDADGDGTLDLLTADGAVQRQPEQVRRGAPYPLAQPDQLFRNLGDGRFAEVGRSIGGPFVAFDVGRGLAVGDVDEDGDDDVLLTNSAGPARLLRNDALPHRWLAVRAVGGGPPRDLLGTRVGLFRPGVPPLWRRLHTDGSYASARDPRARFGLGSAPLDRLEVEWPDGSRTTYRSPPAGHTLVLFEGDGP